jgi:quercetin dioxygenase-like cupin family protein
MKMRKCIKFSLVFVMLAVSSPLMAQGPGIARPNVLVKEIVQGMPTGKMQEVQVLTATIKPGDKTPFHTHRFPVTAYILEGAFTLEMEGHAPVTVKAGNAIVEPPNVKMTGYNRSNTEPVRVLIFYVSEPGTPFLDPVHKQ